MDTFPRDIIEYIFDYVESYDRCLIIPSFYVCKRWYRIVRYRLYQWAQQWYDNNTTLPLFRAPTHRIFLGRCIVLTDHPLRPWALSSSIILGREIQTLINGGSLRHS